MTGRRVRQSSAVTRWIVERIRAMRTMARRSIKPREIVEPEAFQPRQKSDIRRARRLGLEADQVLDCFGYRKLRAAKKHPPFEQGAVERPLAEEHTQRVIGHTQRLLARSRRLS